MKDGDYIYLRIAEVYHVDPVQIRKTWTIYDVLAANDAIELSRVAQQAAHEIAKKNAKVRK